ncbi:ABC transporter substrate-binding protein [Paenibacillus sp. CF384]|uniref:ABC transporter substrate-binding protein n=1 Tax=Paenibacillus sp. CF384 TaxID=1884382 RepID=UPI00089AEA0F|nr:ABC transporter substrate-binding protein [Paenibacillus sp. CF384]SDW14744.1 putative aldouronate transport system substrate-binding protein [Paenibacillus sp. CF384]
MNKLKKRMLPIVTALLVIAVILSGCGNNNSNNTSSTAEENKKAANTTTDNAANATDSTTANTETTAPAEEAKPDNAKEVKLVGYLLGDAPKGMPEVLAALNEKLKADINATLELNYIGWGDVASKYPLILASGEDVDFVFAADWNYYVSEATKGAFMPIDAEMMTKYMPKHNAKLPPEAMQAALINGKSYMIPTSTPDRKVNAAVVRKDILEKAGLTNVTKFSELEPYFAEIKKSYPDMIPLNLDSQYDLPTPWGYLLQEKIAYPGAPIDSGDPSAVGVTTDNEDPAGKIVSMMEEPFLSAEKYATGIMKKWYDAGYINKNPYANKVRSKDNFCEGKSGVAFGNSIDLQATLSACAAKGIDVQLIPGLSPTGHAPSNSWLNNGIAIAANSKNPERALQALDLIMEDEAYVNLVYFGIEGKNYAVTPDGKLTLPEGITPENNTYPPDAAGFWFVNKDFFKPWDTWSDSYIELNKKVKDYLLPATYLGFSFNSESVKSEIANLKNVSTQYASPLFIGVVKNVDDGYATLTSKLKAAGIDKVKAEVEKQAAAFMAAKG